MKKHTLILTLLITFFFQCKKSDDFSDLNGFNTINGVVVLYDTLYGNFSYKGASSIKVYLKNSTNLNGFLYSTSSNGNGQYSFNGIDERKSYTIYGQLDSSNISYYGEIIYPANSITNNQSDTLKLYPSQINQNGIHLIVQDSTGSRIANVTAWVFSNSSQFLSSDTSAGKTFDMTTNSFGVDNKLKISPGKYYLRVITKIGNIDYKGEDSVTVETQGIKPVTVRLSKFSKNKNGLELLIWDNQNTPINNAQVYIYRSQIVFENDTTNNNNSIFMLSSSQSGLTSLYNIDSARYYLRTIKNIYNKTDTTTFKSEDIIVVSSTSVAKDTIRLH